MCLDSPGVLAIGFLAAVTIPCSHVHFSHLVGAAAAAVLPAVGSAGGVFAVSHTPGTLWAGGCGCSLLSACTAKPPLCLTSSILVYKS